MKKYFNFIALLLLISSQALGASKFAQGDVWKNNDLSKTWTPPSTSQTLVGRTSTDTLTNKTLTSPVINTPTVNVESFTEQGSTPSTPPAGTRKIYAKADGVYHLDSTGAEKKVGSGSGGGINLISDGDAENASASIMVPYIGSGSRPVGPGAGSPSDITSTITNTNPLRGTKSFLLTKTGAANSQGRGGKIPFTVDLAHRAKSIKISFDYIVNSGTFTAGTNTTDGDVIVYIWDLTNSVAIEPSNIKLFSSSTTLADKYEATFQTSATGSSYLLMFHVATTTTNNFELKIDDVTVAPSQYVYAPTQTDWINYTPVVTVATGSMTNYTLSNTQYMQDGPNLYIKGKLNFIGATGTWNGPRISLPSGLNFDTTNPQNSIAASVTYTDFGANAYGGEAQPVGTNVIGLGAFRGASGAGIAISQASPFAWGNTDSIEWTVGPIKIAGWTSNQQISDGYDARDLRVNVHRSGSALGGLTPNNSGVKLNIAPNVIEDTYGGWNSSLNRVEIKSSKDYDISFGIYLDPTNQIAAEYLIGMLYKNGAEIASSQMEQVTTGAPRYMRLKGNVTGLKLNAGDYLELYLYSTANHTSAALSVSVIQFNVKANQAPTTMSATEEISLRYFSTSGATTALNTPTTFLYGTRDWDSHNAYNPATGEFKPPRAGRYRVKASITHGSNASATGLANTIFVSGTEKSRAVTTTLASAGFGGFITVIDTLNLVSTDIVTIRPFNTLVGTLATTTSGTSNVLTIELVK